MINHEKNENLQITLKKQDVLKLKQIQADLINRFSIDFTKSQVIAYLIKSYGQTETQTEKPQQTNKNKYVNLIAILKDTLNMSYTELAQYLKVSKNSLNKWAHGIQNPTGENEQILLKALKDNKII